jgi:cytochrome P450
MSVSRSSGVRLDDFLQGEEYAQDPHTVWDRLRSDSPIHWSDTLQASVITSYRLVKQAGKHPCIGGGVDRARGHIAKFSTEQQLQLEALAGYYSRFMSYMNPPQHTEQRSFLSDSFTRRVVENMRTSIQQIVDELITQQLQRGRMDFLYDFAQPMSSSIIVDMLGIPRSDRLMFVEWINRAFNFLGSEQDDFELAKRALETYVNISEYLSAIVEDRLHRPRDDLITEMVKLQRLHPEIPDQRILSLLITVIHGGWETTMTLVSNGMLDLLTHRDEWQKLREHPEMVATAVDEMLRINGPFKGVTRAAQEDFDWEGRHVRKGDAFILILAAANRDPQVFDDPHRFCIDRRPNPHVAFGVGIHYCLGAALAQLEAQVAFASVASRMPNIHLSGEPIRWRRTHLLRQLDSLPVEF